MKNILIICLIVLGGNLFSLIPLTESETEGLLLIREETKLSRDLNLELYDMWEYELFKDIATSEQSYMEKTESVISDYNIDDPVKDDSRGRYTSLYISKLYNDLLKKGKKSPFEALRICATLEDMNIKDLNDLIENTTNQDLIDHYYELKLAAIGHIRALYNMLKENAMGYEAQFLSPEELKAILLN